MTDKDPAEKLASVVSPLLSGVNPKSLDALMAENPAKLDEQEFEAVVDELIRMRKVFADNEAAQEALKSTPRVGTSKGPKAKGTVSVNLEDLFGDE